MKKPHRLFDFLIEQYSLKNDAALSEALKLTPPEVSKIRSGSDNSKYRVSPRVMIIIHKKTGMSIEDIEEMVGFKIE